jgi:hypothetical protein
MILGHKMEFVRFGPGHRFDEDPEPEGEWLKEVKCARCGTTARIYPPGMSEATDFAAYCARNPHQ